MTHTGKTRSAELLANLELARQELQSGSHSVVMAGGGQVLARERGKGLAPLLAVLLEVQGVTGDLALADSIVGLAAAYFLLDVPVRAVYARVISEKAESYLREHGVHVEAETQVAQIMNREGTGMCPLEKIAVESEGPEQARCRIRGFLHRMMSQTQGEV